MDLIVKKIVEFFLNNRALNHLLFILLLMISYFSYENLSKEMFPPSSLETVVVSGSYRSSSSEVLDNLIVKDCEEILSNNPLLSNIITFILKGSYSISADIEEGSSKSLIINDIKTQIEALDTTLPDNMKVPRVYTVERFFPLLSLSIYSNEKDYKKNINIIKELNEEIKKLEYIHKSDLIGKFDKTLRIVLDYKKLDAYGLNKIEAIEAIDSIFSIYPIGKIKSNVEQYFVSTKVSGLTKKDILDIKIKIKDQTLAIKDIAKVKYLFEKNSLSTRTNAKKSIIIMTKKAKKGDSIKLSKQIRELVSKYEKEHSSLEIKVLNDSSFWIKTRLNVISSNIIIGLILLFFAIWIFISFKISLVVLIGIPVSLAFGLIGLDFFGSGLNTLSLIGVLLSLGLLVDEAIVVSENIHRHRLLGKNIQTACIDGTVEVLPTLLVALLTTVIAFLPLLFISGGLGVFVKIIPLMVVVLIVSSFIESFVFLPSHYKLIVSDKSKYKINYKDKMWDTLGNLYKKMLLFCIKYKYIFVVFFIVLILFISFLFIKKSKFILFPEFDAMSINITGKVANNSMSYTSKKIKPLEKILLKKLEKEDYSSIHTTIGMKTDGRSSHEKGDNLFTITINLKPKIADDYFNREINPYFKLFGKNSQEERTRKQTAKMIRNDLQDWFKKYKKEMNLELNIPQTGVVKSDILISFSSNNEKKVKESIDLLKEKMSKIDGLFNIKDDMNYSDIALQVDINDYGRRLGFTQKNIIESLRVYLKTQKLTKVVNDNNELLELKLYVVDKTKLENFKTLMVEVPNSTMKVSLYDISKIIYKNTLSNIKKDNLEKVFSISASTDKKTITSRKFYRKIKADLEIIKAKGIKVYIKGEAGKNKQIQKDITKSLIFAIFGILLILTWFFKSFILSLFSLTVIPLSIFGVLVGHFILGLPLTFSSMLGFVGLIGIVMNDTLLMLNFLKKSKSYEELIENATLRLRPILLTSITTVLGLFTLMFLASGESLLMQPLAVSIGFGLLGATMINLLYIPIAYSIKIRNKKEKND
ncbi:efflux RND transporter permease subunit [Arcobacter sp. LA11]|uniref:efflux RND transporter permease subunit n=1 Tax=Arcobacter sp. LA11 TaxID=1898176 RepID=UPI00093348BD|nr:efflux RND transporter permease subunit [Arcobacter sp. LA11]